jgi:two-component system nitrogen regulation response regulator GlnG
VTDVMLSDGDGIETLGRVREMRPDMPVIILSAQNTLDTAVRASDTNAFEYFPKPFDIDELVRTVRQAAPVRRRGCWRRERRAGLAAGGAQRLDAGGLPDDHACLAQ